MSKLIFASIVWLLMAPVAHALPLPVGPKALMQIPPSLTRNYDFEGIIALSNCSGSLIRFENSKDTDFAVVMTNGHCLESGFPAPGEFVVNQRSNRRLQLMNSRAQVVADLRATAVMYATMTTTDLTLYRVNKTYADILNKTQIRPLTLSSQRPQAGEAIQVVSGYWERGYSCHIDTFSYKMEEAGYMWEDSIRYSNPGCEVIGGTSGSPVIAAGTRTVIAINNTGNESGGRCSRNNPCEINQNGDVFYQRGLSYAQQTYQIYSCLNAQNELDLTLAGCQLPH